MKAVKVVDKRTLNCWVLIHRAEDLPSVWVAHCLDFDVVSQGDSPLHALDMVIEAVVMVACDDLNDNREPLLRRAPEEEWERLFAVTRHGKALDDPARAMAEAADAGPNESLAFALNFPLQLEKVAHITERVQIKDRPMVALEGLIPAVA